MPLAVSCDKNMRDQMWGLYMSHALPCVNAGSVALRLLMIKISGSRKSAYRMGYLIHLAKAPSLPGGKRDLDAAAARGMEAIDIVAFFFLRATVAT